MEVQELEEERVVREEKTSPVTVSPPNRIAFVAHVPTTVGGRVCEGVHCRMIFSPRSQCFRVLPRDL